MTENFQKVRDYLLELEMSIVHEDSENSIFIINKEDEGISNLVIAIAEPVMIMEQKLFEVKQDNLQMYKAILKKNRDIIYGAMALDSDEKNILFRDTLEIENLDLNELAASLESLSMLMSEFGEDILKFAK